jgi:hypothetical protein
VIVFASSTAANSRADLDEHRLTRQLDLFFGTARLSYVIDLARLRDRLDCVVRRLGSVVAPRECLHRLGCVLRRLRSSW